MGILERGCGREARPSALSGFETIPRPSSGNMNGALGYGYDFTLGNDVELHALDCGFLPTVTEDDQWNKIPGEGIYSAMYVHYDV